MKYYAIHKGHNPGVYESWAIARKEIEGFSGAIHRACTSSGDAMYFYQHGTLPPKEKRIVVEPSRGKSKRTLLNMIQSPSHQQEPRHNQPTSIRTSGQDFLHCGSKNNSLCPGMPVRNDRPIKCRTKSTNFMDTEQAAINMAFQIKDTVSADHGDTELDSDEEPYELNTVTPRLSGNLEELIHYYYTKASFSSSTLYIYSDGSTFNNGKNNATGGYGAFFSDPKIPPLSKRLTNTKVTNNICELKAISDSLKCLDPHESRKIILYTDSEYCKLALTVRYPKWEQNGWKTYYKGKTTLIKNKDIIKDAYKQVSKFNITIKWIPSHTENTDLHSIGNSIADLLAKG